MKIYFIHDKDTGKIPLKTRIISARVETINNYRCYMLEERLIARVHKKSKQIAHEFKGSFYFMYHGYRVLERLVKEDNDIVIMYTDELLKNTLAGWLQTSYRMGVEIVQ